MIVLWLMKHADTRPVEGGAVSLEACRLSVKHLYIETTRSRFYFTFLTRPQFHDCEDDTEPRALSRENEACR